MSFTKSVLNSLFRLLPIKKNKILFITDYGENYGGSPKYISETVKDKELGWQRVWAVQNPSIITDDSVTKIRYNANEFLYHFATAGIIITNNRLAHDQHKRKGQIYIQTWHNFLSLKKIGQDTAHFLTAEEIKRQKNDSAQIDYLLVGSKVNQSHFEEAFWFNGKVLTLVTPRIDPLIKMDEAIVEKVRRRFRMVKKDHILLYAPSYRQSNNYKNYIADFTPIQNALAKKFGGRWKVLVRLAPQLKNESRSIIKNKNVQHASLYPDLQELLMAADFLVTDYSSLVFDSLITQKPALLYQPDLSELTSEECSLYYRPGELPFLYAKSAEEIVRNIKDYDEMTYRQKIEDFFSKVNSYEKGNASEKVVEFLRTVIR